MKGQENQWEPVDTFGSVDPMPREARIAAQRGAAWEAYIAGGVGDPWAFDYPTMLRQSNHRAALQEERERGRGYER